MFNKHGLTGNSGLAAEYNKTDFFHIAGNYGINNEDEVFVNSYYNEDWTKEYKHDNNKLALQKIGKRINKAIAIKNNHEIILCEKCNIVPAVTLDHHYPYMYDFNLCEKCKEGK